MHSSRATPNHAPAPAAVRHTLPNLTPLPADICRLYMPFRAGHSRPSSVCSRLPLVLTATQAIMHTPASRSQARPNTSSSKRLCCAKFTCETPARNIPVSSGQPPLRVTLNDSQRVRITAHPFAPVCISGYYHIVGTQARNPCAPVHMRRRRQRRQRRRHISSTPATHQNRPPSTPRSATATRTRLDGRNACVYACVSVGKSQARMQTCGTHQEKNWSGLVTRSATRTAPRRAWREVCLTKSQRSHTRACCRTVRLAMPYSVMPPCPTRKQSVGESHAQPPLNSHANPVKSHHASPLRCAGAQNLSSSMCSSSSSSSSSQQDAHTYTRACCLPGPARVSYEGRGGVSGRIPLNGFV